MLSFVVKASGAYIPYFAAFPMVARRYLKTLLTIWVGEPEVPRILAFMNIRQLALDVPYPFIDMVMKGVYLTYVKHSKFTSQKNLSLIAFLCNCVVEIFGLDFTAGYQHAFIYIRQLAIHLRGALNLKTKDAHRSVYNWQFLNSVRFFVRLMALYPKQQQFQPLLFPLTQLLYGVIQLSRKSTYYPLHLHVIHFLNELAAKCEVFIPVAPFIFEILSSSEASKKPRPSTERTPDFFSVIKVPKTVLNTKSFQDILVSTALDLLTENLAIYSYSVSFPELALSSRIFLKKFLKNCPCSPNLRKQGSVLVEKLDENSNFISNKRAAVDFTPQNITQISYFQQQSKKASQSPLERYHINCKKREEDRRRTLMEQQHEENQKERENRGKQRGEQREEQRNPDKKKGKKAKNEDFRNEDDIGDDDDDDGAADYDDDDDNDDDIDQEEMPRQKAKKNQKGKEKPQKKEKKQPKPLNGKQKPRKDVGEMEDVVEDLEFSDSD